MQKVRWGIVSAGRIAHTFAEDCAHAASAEVVAVAARRLADAEAFAAKHGIERAFEGYDQLFADDDIDAVYVATPHTLHLPNAADALRAGKAVLCEKPLTVSASECRTLLTIAQETGGYLLEGMWTWFLPAVQQARKWFEAGRIGELRHIRAEFGYPRTFDPEDRLFDPHLAGGCLLDMGVYPVALARLFTGTAPVEVHAVAGRAPNGVDNDVVMTMRYDGSVAALACSFCCKLPNYGHIVGAEGIIEIPNFWSASECRLLQMHDIVDVFEDDRRGSGFEFQIEAASRDILAGRHQSAIVSHAASLGFQEDMDRIRAAAETVKLR